MSNLLWKSELMNLMSIPMFMEGSHVTRGFDRSDSAAHALRLSLGTDPVGVLTRCAQYIYFSSS